MGRFSAICLICLVIPCIVFGKNKKLKTTDIIAVSDSLLAVNAGQTLFGYCKLGEGSYYSCKKRGKVHYYPLSYTTKLRKHLYTAHLIYTFRMPYPECPDLDTVAGSIALTLQRQDSSITLIREPDLGFIPETAKDHQRCNIIRREEAIDIARKDTIKVGTTQPYAQLEYDAASKTFRWVVQSLMWNEKDFQNDIPSKKDRVTIDALSGVILEHKIISYSGESEKDSDNLE